MKAREGGEAHELEEEIAEVGPASAAAADALVLGASAHLGSPETAAYLAAQTRLLGVQFEHMHEQRILQLEHLRVRRWRERLQISIQLMLWALAAAIVAGVVALAFWAMQDQSLVIQPFKSPPLLAAQGLDGPVLAAKLLDGVKTLQGEASSARAPSTMKGAAEDDIKVEIPETGVSVGELLKYLRAWLGHETQVTGEAYVDGADLVLTVRVGDEAGESFRGPLKDLDHLVAQASEAVFAKAQPYLYAVYLSEHGRKAESLRAARALAISGPPAERGWAYAHWANLLLQQGDDAGAAIRARAALARNAGLVTAENNLAIAEWNLAHDEAAFQARREALALIRPGRPANVTAAAADQFRVSFEELLDEALGDYGAAAALSRQQMELPDYSDDVAEASISIADDLAEDHDIAAARSALAQAGLKDDAGVLKYLAADNAHAAPYAMLDAALDDWNDEVVDLRAADVWMAANAPNGGDYRVRRLRPELALALARAGRGAEADQVIDATPLDCDVCLRVRGTVAALQGRSATADGWFRQAVASAPSLPRPYLAWGEALLARGDAGAAVERARQAVQKGPHFADAYVLWARALLRQDRPGAAVAKLAIADRYAPAWGRLHLLWGEGLSNLGRGEQAQAQFRQASALALSAADQVRLAHDLKGG